MSFLLDTNICSVHLRRPSGLVHRFIQHSGRLHISSIVLGELYAWAYWKGDPIPLVRKIDELLQDINVIPFDRPCAERFGKLRGVLQRKGLSTSPVDLMIASVALDRDLTLVTNNTADFEHIPDLRIEDWLTP